MVINRESVSKPALRVSAFVDGFNLYHAIHDLGRNELKWLDLRALLCRFVDPKLHSLGDVYYFSAYADWQPAKHRRHMAYVRALRHVGVTPVMGNFKEKSCECRRCGARWTSHEEKQSDVNLAVHLVREAYKDSYDQAFIVTGDSDLTPPVKLLGEIFPEKRVKIICPPGRYHSKELVAAAKRDAKIQVLHLERSLFPEKIATPTGPITRPVEYAPPARAN